LNGSICRLCRNEIRKDNKSVFIKKSIETHGNKYDYSLVKYQSSQIKVKIICPVHGVFEQTPNNHIKGNGCSKCANNFNYNDDEFIRKCILKHNIMLSTIIFYTQIIFW